MQIDILFEAFVQQGRFLRGWSPRTVKIYQVAFRRLTRAVAAPDTRQVQDVLSKATIDAWVVQMRQEGLTPGGCNVNIRSVNSFLTWLHAEGHVTAVLRARLLRKPADALPSFSEEEIRSLVSFRPKNIYQSRAWVLVLTLLDTGIRIDEALGLETALLDLDGLQMQVRGKGGKVRIVPFSLTLRRHLFRTTNKSACRFVFHTHRGDRLLYRNAYRDIKRICTLAGVTGAHVHPHAFRHFFAVNFVRRGRDIYRLSRILGHSSISTTQLYLRSMTAEQVGEGHCSPLT